MQSINLDQDCIYLHTTGTNRAVSSQGCKTEMKRGEARELTGSLQLVVGVKLLTPHREPEPKAFIGLRDN